MNVMKPWNYGLILGGGGECHSNVHIINLILKGSCEIQLNLALLIKQFWLWLGVLEVSGCLLCGWGC